MKRFLSAVMGIVLIGIVCTLSFGCEAKGKWASYNISADGMKQLRQQIDESMLDDGYDRWDTNGFEMMSASRGQLLGRWSENRWGMVHIIKKDEDILEELADYDGYNIEVSFGAGLELEDAHVEEGKYVIVARTKDGVMYAGIFENDVTVLVFGDDEGVVEDLLRWLSTW